MGKILKSAKFDTSAKCATSASNAKNAKHAKTEKCETRGDKCEMCGKCEKCDMCDKATYAKYPTKFVNFGRNCQTWNFGQKIVNEMNFKQKLHEKIYFIQNFIEDW